MFLDTTPSNLQEKEQEVISMATCKSFAEFANLNENLDLCTVSVGEISGACHVNKLTFILFIENLIVQYSG